MSDFRKIIGYEKYYQINSQGNVQNLKTGQILTTFSNYRNKNPRLALSKNTKRKMYYVHKLLEQNFNQEVSDNYLKKHHNDYKDNMHKEHSWKFKPYQIVLTFPNGIQKTFDSYRQASLYLGKNKDYLSYYSHLHPNNPYVFKDNQLICHFQIKK